MGMHKEHWYISIKAFSDYFFLRGKKRFKQGLRRELVRDYDTRDYLKARVKGSFLENTTSSSRNKYHRSIRGGS